MFGIFSIAEWIHIFGVSSMMAMTGVVFYTFFLAYFSSLKVVVVYINLSGEANLEAILMLIVLLIGSFAFQAVLRDVRARAIWRRALITEKIRRI